MLLSSDRPGLPVAQAARTRVACRPFGPWVTSNSTCWFRMSKSDLQARPIYHRKRDPIEAHLTIVFAALAISHWIETTTGWSIKKFVRTARRYRTITIQAGPHTIAAADPVPDDLRAALAKINNASRGAH
jgi:hypothetical protein